MADSATFTMSLGSKNPESKSSSQTRQRSGTKRPHAALHDSDDEDEDGRHQEITHFDTSAGGAVHAGKAREEKAPLIIPVGENRRKKQKSALPSHNTEAAEAAVAETKAKAAPVSFGLNVREKTVADNDAETTNKVSIEAVPVKKQTVDEEALAALTGNSKTSSNTVIPALTDEEVFYRDYDAAPGAPTEADYDAVPIGEFGAAMLRGMGWKDGEAIGKNRGQAPVQQRTLERRPELLGVGAKPAKALGIELGEWGKHAKKHERKINQTYAPVMLKNKKTGEMITEEEMQALTKTQDLDLVDDESQQSAKRSEHRSHKSSRRTECEDDRDEGRDSRRNRDRDRERGYDDRKHKSSRRDRSRSYDERKQRRDHDDDDRDRRERRREKDSKYRDHDERDERHRSHRRDDEHRGKHRDRKYRDEDRSYRAKSHREDRGHDR